MKLNRHAERVIRALLSAPRKKLDIWQLARKCGYLPDIISAVEQLKRAGVVTTHQSAVALVNTKKLPAYVLKRERPLKQVMKAYMPYWKQISFYDDNFGQIPLMPSAIHNKLALMQKRGDLLNKDILCIGDDDLFSVACALTGLPRSVTVFDYDERVIALIKSISPKLPVPIKTFKVNLLEPLSERYHARFDVFITEPEDTEMSTLLFITQGMRTLRLGGSFYLGMAEATLNPKNRGVVERTLANLGIVFTDILHGSEEYVPDGREVEWEGFEKMPTWITKSAQSSWFTSTLFRGEVVEKKKLPFLRPSKREFFASFVS